MRLNACPVGNHLGSLGILHAGRLYSIVRVDMKKTQRSRTRKSVSEEMLAEYSFDYQKARPNRFAGRVDKGRVIVILDPDVSEVFPDQQTVNTALRALINAVPRLPSPKTARS